VIRFQNTGTDVAYKVVVVDTLSADLDVSTLQLGSCRIPYKVQVSGKGRPVLTFTFNNILLPDSNANEPASHGYIQFSIKPKAGLPEKTRIENFADILFDYNEPVRTNTTFNTLYDLPPVPAETVKLDGTVVCVATNTTATAGSSRTVCGQDTVRLTALPARGSGRWQRIGGTATVTDPENPAARVSGLAYGNNVFEWRVAANTCGTDSLAGRVTITRLRQPAVPPSPSRGPTASRAASPRRATNGTWRVARWACAPGSSRQPGRVNTPYALPGRAAAAPNRRRLLPGCSRPLSPIWPRRYACIPTPPPVPSWWCSRQPSGSPCS
jgi:hypothetical protein